MYSVVGAGHVFRARKQKPRMDESRGANSRVILEDGRAAGMLRLRVESFRFGRIVVASDARENK